LESTLRKPSFVFFDLDGVLVDSEPIKADAHIKVSRTMAGVFRTRADYSEVMGRSQLEVTRHFLRGVELTSSTLNDYDRQFWHCYRDLLFASIAPMPDARSTVSLIRATGIGVAVVTSSPRELVAEVLERAGLCAAVSFTICAEDVTNHKPYSAPYVAALRKANTDATDCVAVEDTDAGLESAVGAGIVAVAFRNSLNTRQLFSKASFVLAKLAQLPELWASSPTTQGTRSTE
jgi:HAD superfamily hydrolase (TIGR01509 family)